MIDLLKQPQGDFPQLQFGLSQIEKQATKNGDPYLKANFAYLLDDDTIRTLPGKIWQINPVQAAQLTNQTVIQARGYTKEFNNQLEINLQGNDVKLLPDADFTSYIPHSYWDQQTINHGIKSFMEQINNSHYQQIVVKAYSQVTQDMRQQGLHLDQMPAAIKNHHAFLSGLFTHTLSMLKMAQGILDNTYYDHVFNRDLIYSGILLHDLGKAYCYTDELNHKSTLAGTLLDHIMIIDGLLVQIAEQVYQQSYHSLLTNDEFLQLRHLVIAHHGKQEWGSPQPAQTPEAWFVHQIDNTDAKLETIREVKLNEPVNKNGFTKKIWTLDNHQLYLGKPKDNTTNTTGQPPHMPI